MTQEGAGSLAPCSEGLAACIPGCNANLAGGADERRGRGWRTRVQPCTHKHTFVAFGCSARLLRE